ncbi:MAG: hypothetical protein AAGJ56_10500 [Myxococcota bacterium]
MCTRSSRLPRYIAIIGLTAGCFDLEGAPLSLTLDATARAGSQELAFEWQVFGDDGDLDRFRLDVALDSAPFSPVPEASAISGERRSFSQTVSLHLANWRGRTYRLTALDEDGAELAASDPLELDRVLDIRESVQALDFENADSLDLFGTSVAVSGDGNRLAVGAVFEDGSLDSSDNDAPSSGAVYVYERREGSWALQSYLKSDPPSENAWFGRSLAFSFDGSTLAVGADGETLGDPDPIFQAEGAAYVFRYEDSRWVQEARLMSSNPDVGDFFGQSIALSSDGGRLAVGAPFDDDPNGIEPGTDPGTSVDTGAVSVFRRSDAGEWTAEAYLRATSPDTLDRFGFAVSLSANGELLAVGTPGEDSSTALEVGVDNDAQDSGAVFVFRYEESSWRNEAYLKASNSEAGDGFGSSVVLAEDGASLAVGAPFEDGDLESSVTSPNDNAEDAGAVYVFGGSDQRWEQFEYIKAGEVDLRFGARVSFSVDGSVLTATSIASTDSSTTLQPAIGVACTFSYRERTATLTSCLNSPTENAFDGYGASVSLSADGSVLAVGASGDDTSAIDAGRVYVY